jgi:hypothetical protein
MQPTATRTNSVSAPREATMLRWLPPDEGLHTIQLETMARVEEARRANLVDGSRPRYLTWFAGLRDRVRYRHAMTDYPCRLPDGRMGRTAIRHLDGDWVAVCVR